jgi:hypothetical protein
MKMKRLILCSIAVMLLVGSTLIVGGKFFGNQAVVGAPAKSFIMLDCQRDDTLYGGKGNWVVVFYTASSSAPVVTALNNGSVIDFQNHTSNPVLQNCAQVLADDETAGFAIQQQSQSSDGKTFYALTK